MVSIAHALAPYRKKSFFTKVITDTLAANHNRLVSKGLEPIRFDRGDPTEQHPRINSALVEVLKTNPKHRYGNIAGETFYREAAGKYLARRFRVDNINYNGSDQKLELCVLPGSNDGIFKTICHILDEGIILLPFPGYPAYYDDAYEAGYRDINSPSTKRVLPYFVAPENNFMPDIEEIFGDLGADKTKVRAIFINYPSNPTGAKATLEYYEKLIAFARRKGILIVSDAAYVELYSPDSEPSHSILEVKGAKDVAIEFHSQSKTYGITGLRLGWVAGNKLVISRMMHLTSIDNICSAPILIQQGGAEILNNDDGYTDRMRKEYHMRRETLREGLQANGWRIVSDLNNIGTFYEWVGIPDGKSSLPYALELIKQKGIAGIPGILFSDSNLAPGSEVYGEGFMRIALLQPIEKIREAIIRLSK